MGEKDCAGKSHALAHTRAERAGPRVRRAGRAHTGPAVPIQLSPVRLWPDSAPSAVGCPGRLSLIPPSFALLCSAMLHVFLLPLLVQSVPPWPSFLLSLKMGVPPCSGPLHIISFGCLINFYTGLVCLFILPFFCYLLIVSYMPGTVLVRWSAS